MKQKIKNLKLPAYLELLQINGRYTFTKQELQQKLKLNEPALKKSLHRLKQKGLITNPARGFYIIIPPEYRKAGSLPPEQFIADLMQYRQAQYYVGLLSAAQLYGAAHQRPQLLQVITNQKRRALKCGNFKISFIAKRNLKDTPTKQFKTQRGYYLAATSEATAKDLLIYLQHGAGINNVLTVLSELADSMDAAKLKKLVKTSKEIAWAQRLGYLLDFLGEENLSKALYVALQNFRLQKCPLLPRQSTKRASLNKKWQILVNAELESDL